LHRRVLAENDFGVLLQTLPIKLREKTKPAEIDADQWQLPIDDAAGLPQQSAVAAEHDCEIGTDFLWKGIAIGFEFANDLGMLFDDVAKIADEARDLRP